MSGVTADGASYWIDSNTYMAKGWRQVNGKWYFLRLQRSHGQETSGKRWKKTASGFICADGAMLTNTTTPDGSRVDEKGGHGCSNISIEKMLRVEY